MTNDAAETRFLQVGLENDDAEYYDESVVCGFESHPGHHTKQAGQDEYPDLFIISGTSSSTSNGTTWGGSRKGRKDLPPHENCNSEVTRRVVFTVICERYGEIRFSSYSS